MTRPMGLLACLDPDYRAVIEAKLAEREVIRSYAASRLSALYFCTDEAARLWLDSWAMDERPADYLPH